MSNSISKPVRAFILIMLLAVSAVFILDPLTRHRGHNFWMASNFITVVLVSAIVILFLSAMVTRSKAVVKVVGLVLVVTVSGTFIYAGVTGTYRADKKYLSQSVEVSKEHVPGTFNTRAPLSVAQNTVKTSLGDVVGVSDNTKYLPTENRYSSTVERITRFFGFRNPGYNAVVEQNYDKNGNRVDSKTCKFSNDAKLSMGGPLQNSLERKVAAIDFTLTTNRDDMWSYCDGDTPKVVMPVTKRAGFFTHTVRPAGVVIYNGKNNALEYKPEVAAGELPGPVVGISYSARVNDSIQALNSQGYWDYQNGITGYTDEVKQDSDINASNPTNFGLFNDKLGNTFVTPFTSRAASTNISYMGVTNANELNADNLGKVTLYPITPERNDNGVLADQIRTRFPNIAWQSGLKIQEFTPKSDNVWVATIGHDTTFAYRVTITADAKRQGVYKFIIANADGADDETGENAGDDSPKDDSGKSKAGGSFDLSKMSDDEIAKVIQDATHELVNRNK